MNSAICKMDYYLLDFYDLGCTMKPTKKAGKNTFIGNLNFPDGNSAEILFKEHAFCVATILKCISGEQYFDNFSEQNKDFILSQKKSRKQLDVAFSIFRYFIILSFVLITLACISIYFPLFVLAIFLNMVYKYYIYPKMVVFFTDRHVELIKYTTKD